MSKINDIKKLKERLEIAENRIKKSVYNAQKNLENEKILLSSLKKKSLLIEESMFQIISEKIINYFEEKTIAEIDSYELELLVRSEIAYYLLMSNFPIEPLSISITYNKIIDHFIKTRITHFFYKQKNFISRQQPQNIFREKRLYNTLYYDHSISMGTLSALISKKDEETKEYYEDFFWKTIRQKTGLGDIFGNKNFLDIFLKINASEVFSEKRHFGEISLEEIQYIRKLFTGNFSDKNSLIYYIL